jgi:SAM-dependent methyltransferase
VDADALEAAAELCRLTGTGDLLSWLGLSSGVTGEEAREALGRERKRMQSMQANPKYKDVARHLLKTWRKIDVVLADPEAYLQALGEREASARLPLLKLAIDGVLADGVLTSEEEAFVREQALALGIEVGQYERLLKERCAALGVALPEVRDPTPAPPVFATVEPDTGAAPRARPVPEGTGWWDDAFTRTLLEHIPPDTTRTIDLACGLGVAAVVLLRERARMEYLGVDPNPLHVDVARRNLEQAGLGGRAVFQQLDPSKPLPLGEGMLDLALCVMSLHHFADTRPVLREAARLVRVGGRFVAVEPDTTAQQFWFDGNLRAFNHLFQGLCERADRVRRAASGTDDPLGQPGVALGPELGRRMSEVGLRPVTTVVHPVQVDHPCAFPSFARRLRRRIEAMRDAAGLQPEDTLVKSATLELEKLERNCDPHRIGTAVHVLPVFVVVGVK